MPGTWTIYWPYFSPMASGESVPVPFTIAGIGSSPSANWVKEARDYAAATLPIYVPEQGFRQSLAVEKDLGWDGQGRKYFAAVARFGPSANSETPEVAEQDSRPPDEAVAALVGARMYGTPGRIEIAEAAARFPDTLPNHGLLIRSEEGDGCEVLEVTGDMTLEKRLPLGLVSAYIKDVVEPLISPRPRMNNATFWGRPQGSLLFVDYDLSINGKEGVIRGHFQYKPNLSDETVAGISGVTANGHDEIKAFYISKPVEDTSGAHPVIRTGRELKGFYVYQVYKFGDFAALKMLEPTP